MGGRTAVVGSLFQALAELGRGDHREKGLKLLFYGPGNVRDLLALGDPDRAARIDFAHRTLDPTTYIAADCRHVASDLVPKAPSGNQRGGQRRMVVSVGPLWSAPPDSGSCAIRQQTLMRLLRLRFKRVPRPVEQVIRSTDDVARLDAWLDGVVKARTLVAVGIPVVQDP